MTRQFAWALLVCFTLLAILPGCRNMPNAPFAPEGPPPMQYASERVQPSEKSVIAVVEVRDESTRTAAKLAQGTPNDTGLKLLDLSLQAKQPAEGTKKHVKEPTTGLAEIDLGPDLSAPKFVNSQVPPLPQVVDTKREYAAVLDALKAMLEDRPQEAIKYLRAYDEKSQEFFLRLLPPLTILVKKRFDDLSPQEVAVLCKQLDGLLGSLRSRSELTVSKMCYCKRVYGFGSYVPLPDNHAFLTGTEDRIGEQVQLYVELQNFMSEKAKDGNYVTKLACALELHDAAGKKVWSTKFEGNETTLRRSARMNDFFSNYSFYVPAIPAGTYQLTLQVVDETLPEQRRVARESLLFRVTPVANQPPLR